MNFLATRAAFCLLLAGGPLALSAAPSQMETPPPHTADAAAFREYLTEHNLAARWSGDPAPLASPELRAAFPGCRFYYTFQRPPTPPGAYLPALIAAHQRAMEEYQSHSLRLTVGIDERGRVHAFSAPEDFNTGLKPVATDEEARTAAAAILSLLGTREASPGALPPQEFTVTRDAAGWTCHFSQKPRGIQGTVTFDPRGRCTAVSKSLNYVPPVPY